MRIPKESLDDFIGKAAARNKPDPPTVVHLRRTGEIEEIKPLAGWDGPRRSRYFTRKAFTGKNPYGLSWFHRSLILSGSAVAAVLVAGIGIYFGVFGTPSDASSGSDILAGRRQTERLRTPPKVMGPFELRTAPIVPTRTDEISDIQPVVKRRLIRPHVVRAVYRPRLVVRRPQLAVTNFVPTTLVIYAENGKIKSRIEPQLTAAYKKQSAIPN